jgi:hypothetical protein
MRLFLLIVTTTWCLPGCSEISQRAFELPAVASGDAGAKSMKTSEKKMTTPPGPEKIKTLQLDTTGYRFVMYTNGQVTGVKDGKRMVLAEPKLLEEPEYRYLIDRDGDLSRHPKGIPWSPPVVVARQLASARLDLYKQDRNLGGIRFAKLPFDSVAYYESELLEPDRALAAWEEARVRSRETGLSPVIRTFRIQDHNLEGWQKGFGELAKDREKAASLDVAAFFKRREADLDRAFAESARDGEGPADEVAVQRATLKKVAHGDLKRREPKPYHYQMLGQYVVLVLVSCEPWELPVCLQFGGWNQSPNSNAQSAVLRHWSKLYGAELVVAGGDFLEMRTTKALTPEELKTAAWEQFLLADDIVFQGTKSVDNLAKEIRAGHWYFWWD